MVDTTGLAVGLAVGIPSAVILSVGAFTWYRGAKRLKREMDEEDTRNTHDLNLDEISIHRDVNDIKVDHRASTINKMNSDVSLLHSSDHDINEQKRSSSGNVTIDTNSKTTNTKNNLTPEQEQQLQQNYMNYYDSVIPMLPPRGKVDPESSNSSSSSIIPPTTDQFQQQPPQPGFMRRISKSMKKSSNNGSMDQITQQSIPRSTSHSSINTEYIKTLNKNDSSSFPLTTHTLANASNHAINVYNNFNPSRSGSGLNLYNTSKSPSLTSDTNLLSSKSNSNNNNDNLNNNNSSESNNKLKKSNNMSHLALEPGVALKEGAPLENETESITDLEPPLKSPFEDVANTPPQRFSQYLDDTSQEIDKADESIGIDDDDEDDSGIIKDEGYTNYENNKKSFLNSLRPK